MILFPFDIVLGLFLLRAIGQEKAIKGIHVRKEEGKLCLFTNDMTLYMENPSIPEILLELKKKNQLSKIARYKMNI